MSISTRTKKGIRKGKAKALQLAAMVAEAFMVTPELEYRFAAIQTGGTGKGLRERLKAQGLKDWRFDVALPEYKIAVEFEGGLFIAKGGRHNRGIGMVADMDKYRAATVHGWRVLRYSHTHHTYAQIMGDIARIIQPTQP